MMPNVRLLLSVALVLLSSSVSSEEQEVPAELLKLRALFDAEIQRVTEVPKRRYAEALERLQTNYTRNGELAKALKVKEEIQSLNEAETDESKRTVNDRILYGSEWLWGSGGTLTLERNGDALHTAWSVPGSWKKMRDGTVSIQRPGSDPPMVLEFSDETFTHGTVTSHVGAKTSLRRVIK